MCYITTQTFEMVEDITATMMIVSGEDAVKSGYDSNSNEFTFEKPYILRSGVSYALRIVYGRPQMWEINRIEKPNGDVKFAFIREAQTKED